MKKESKPTLHIQPHFSPLAQSKALMRHFEQEKRLLEDLLPAEFFSLLPDEAQRWLDQNLPLVIWDEPDSIPDRLSIFFLCSPTHEVKAEKVLPDLIRKWLIPEKEIQILGFHNMYFHMREISSGLFFVAEMQILVEDQRDWELMREHLPLLAGELNLSLSSSRYLEHILDTKALSLDQKSTQIQQYLRKLTQRVPNQFSLEIFKEMSSFLALSKPDFRKFRLPKHLTRLVVSHYLMRKNILHHISVAPEKRHLDFRFIRSKLHYPFGTKSVLGLSISVGLADRYETFEDTHILAAVQKFFPQVQIVKGSYYYFRANHDPVKSIYVELEKKDGNLFSLEEINFLKKELKEELKKRIEKLIPSVFMIRNEEEVMRNILLLSQQLKYLADLPQVMINFEKQMQDSLSFTVIVVRVRKKHDLPLEEALAQLNTPFEVRSIRTQNVGYVRKKNPKEANVFHLQIPVERSIMRADSSINFYTARHKVLTIIMDALGEVRDYNGGMILKQGELFAQLRHAFGGIAEKNQELLENFFFALNPIEAQATAPLAALKTLFKLFLDAGSQDLPKRESHFLKVKKRKNFSFAVIRSKDRSLEVILNEELNKLENFSKTLTKSQITFQGTILQGLIYETSNPEQQKQFQKSIDHAVKKWLSKVLNQQELRLSFIELPPSLDPRLGGDETYSTLTKMLFDGLTRLAKDSKPALAIARSIDISADQKTYTFKLRPSFWSDGSKLVAHDFEYAWKKILSPSFYTPFAFFFYPIKNARAAKEGQVPLDEIKVKAVDEHTLVVELEYPCPEFLEFTSHSLYSPVMHKIDTLHPNWSESRVEEFVCNGPFKLKKFHPTGGYELVKNPYFWDKNKVKLDRIIIQKNSSETAFEMYKNDEIDWIGHTLGPWEPYFDSESGVKAQTKPVGLQWCVFNTQRFPFDHLKMRQAFSYAINRQEIVDELPGELFPAISPIPRIHTSLTDDKQVYGDKKLARRLFEEALKELGLTRKNFPILTLCFAGGEMRRSVAEALIKQWEETFQIFCRLEKYEFYLLFSKLKKGEYHFSTIAWKAWINDPSYTLNVFQYRNNRVNFPKWEHPEYQAYLEKAKQEILPEKRGKFYKEAELILNQECPVLPIHDDAFRYMYKSRLKGVLSSDLGHIDFREAYVVPE